MRTRLLLAPALGLVTVLATLASAAPAPKPQVTDAAGDANFVNGQGSLTGGPAEGTALPAGNQAYADVLSVLWEKTTSTKKVGKKTVTTVTGIRVTATLSGPPTPPPGTVVVYRMLGTTEACPFFGVVYYTTATSDAAVPQSAVRDNCTGATRLTKIALPVIKGSTLTWTAPLTAFPKEVKLGNQLTKLRVEIREIENFPPGACTPEGTPSLGRACGLGTGQIDQANTDATFRIG